MNIIYKSLKIYKLTIKEFNMKKLQTIGSGTYGVVYNALHSDKNSKEIAVKRNIIDSDISFSGSIKEMDLLNRLRGHPYIVKLISVSFGNPFTVCNSPIINKKGYSYKEDYLHFIFEKGDKNLHSLIYEREIHVSYLKLAMIHLLLAVEYMHAKGVIHRDIKPANLLWFVENGKGCVKLCDFGLSKIKSFQEPSSPHLVTCWYRAPEICSKDDNYSFSSDMWSVGCVMYEMISKKALLLGSKDDDKKILSKIVGIIPSPDSKDIFNLTNGNKIQLTKEASPRYRKTWKEMINLSKADVKEFNKYPGKTATYKNYLDLIERMLHLNRKDRITAKEALEHDFCNPYKEIIDWCHGNFPAIAKKEPDVNIIECKERKWATKLAFIIFNNRTSLLWYRHRIIFQSIDMFDRYLEYLQRKGEYKTETDKCGKYLSRYDTELRFIVCLYMCIKYFSTLSLPIPFEELTTEEYRNEKALQTAEEFEKFMLQHVLRFKVYRETIYEAIDRTKSDTLDDHQIRDLLLAYGTSTDKENIKPSELLKLYMKTE